MSKDLSAVKGILKEVEVLAVYTAYVARGGLEFKDIPAMLELLKEVPAFVAAVKALGEAELEIKDLDSVEALELLAAILDVVKKVKLAAQGQEPKVALNGAPKKLSLEEAQAKVDASVKEVK